MFCYNMLGMLCSETFSLAVAVSARPYAVRSMHTGNCEHDLYDPSAYAPGGWHGEGTRPPSLPDGFLPDLPGSAKPRSHLLVELLRYEDFYHASPTLENRLKGPLVVAERDAEIRLLRRLGWHVICVPEQRWQLGEEGDHEAASEANRRLIFELVADMAGPE
eukprot:s3946_g2.t1